MTRKNFLIHRSLVAAALALIGSACSLGNPPAVPPDDGIFVEPVEETAEVHGTAWDPEAMWFSVASCGEEACPQAPAFLNDNPIFSRSIVADAQISLRNADTHELVAEATGPTDEGGAWHIPSVAMKHDPGLISHASGGRLVDVKSQVAGENVPALPDTPETTYLPTLHLNPLYPDYSACLFQNAPLIGRNGVLQAVARALTAEGVATTVDDFLDTSKYGGVVVWWLMNPSTPVYKIPAFTTAMQTDVGRAFNLDWKPVGDSSLSPEEAASQSERGFYVKEDEVSRIGFTVVLLPPSSTPQRVRFVPFDPVVNASAGRPFGLDAPVDVLVAQGVVNFGPLMLLPAKGPDGTRDYDDDYPPWLCFFK